MPRRAHSGPAFLDFPLDVVFMEAPSRSARAARSPASAPRGRRAPRSTAPPRCCASAERPVIMAGTNLYWGHGEDALRALAEALGIPVFLNGLARGCLPADHRAFFSRARGAGAQGRRRRARHRRADGLPARLRRRRSARRPRSWSIDRRRARARPPAPGGRRALRRRCPRSLGALRAAPAARDTGDWVAHLRAEETSKREAERAELDDDRAPLHPMRLYARARARSSTATRSSSATAATSSPTPGRVVDSYEPGCWLDPGPFGCLGSGPGYALAAKLAHPDRQVVLLLGDGAFGFSGMEFDTLARHGVDVVGVMGNNGIWALEKHPMEFLYGYSVAAELRPETRYDQVVEALGGHGELVRAPGELRPALERAFEAAGPALVNVLTDPTSSTRASRTWRRPTSPTRQLPSRCWRSEHAAYAIEAELIGAPSSSRPLPSPRARARHVTDAASELAASREEGGEPCGVVGPRAITVDEQRHHAAFRGAAGRRCWRRRRASGRRLTSQRAVRDDGGAASASRHAAARNDAGASAPIDRVACGLVPDRRPGAASERDARQHGPTSASCQGDDAARPQTEAAAAGGFQGGPDQDGQGYVP